MVFEWLSGHSKDKKCIVQSKDTRSKDKRSKAPKSKKPKSKTPSPRQSGRVTIKIHMSNIAEDQERGTGAYKSNMHATGRRVFEKDELAEVKEHLEKNNHLLCEFLGSGSFADVYRGRNKSANKDVAVKIIKLCDANRHYQETFLESELEVIQLLSHRRIIQLYSLFQSGNKICMLMEFADRGTMGDLISKRGALREVASWALFKEIHIGLAYMHSKMVAHRDLKLENILINKHWVPKLADFSFSIIWDGKTLCTQFCGSVAYFAPELLRHEPYNPFLTDVWSEGVCLFIMTNDNFPFNLDDDREMLKAQLDKKWTFRPQTDKQYPARFKDLINRMLEPRVSKRFDAIQVTAHAWVNTDIN